MARHCSRPSCASNAVATLTYNHERAIAWLADLTPQREPHAYDLCARHADGALVPQGWRLEDTRTRPSRRRSRRDTRRHLGPDSLRSTLFEP